MTISIENLNWEKVGGLMPAIIQDNVTSNILMLGYMNVEALQKTISSNLVTFYSRTRKTLWQKGETSGNVLNLISIKCDCDSDTLLIQASPIGPTCHKGWDTCFNEENTSGAEWLQTLENIIKVRGAVSPEESYTAKLMEKGVKRIAQKVGEEGVEVALAATAGDREELISESADLLYHLTVLLTSQNIELRDVIEELKSRHKE